MMRRLLIIVIGILLCAGPLQAGVSAVDPLFLPRLPLYTAYGMSGVAANLGAESGLVNPAVLAASTGNIVSYVQGTLFGELNTSTFMISRLGEIGGGGISVYYTLAQSNAIHITCDNDYDNHPNTIGSFKNTYQGVLLSYYREIGSGLYAGAGVKHISVAIDKSSATGIGFHAGLATARYVTPIGTLRGGAVVYNPGSTVLNWDTGDEDIISQVFRLGGELQASLNSYQITALADYDSAEGTSFGGQVGYPALGLQARGGTSSLGSTFGVSYTYQQLTFSLAYLAHQELGGSYSFSVAYILDATSAPRRHRSFTIEHANDISLYPLGEGATGNEVIELPNPSPAPDIGGELERFRQKQPRTDAIQKVAPCEVQFIPSILRAGQDVQVKVEVLPAGTSVTSVEISLAGQTVELTAQENIAGLDNFSASIRSLVRKAENAIYAGEIHLPNNPGRYEIVIRIITSSKTHEVRKIITVN